MKRRIETKVIAIEDEAGEKFRVILQCPEGDTIAPKATVSANPIMVDQEQLVAAIDRINVLGKGKPSVRLGDTVEVQVFSTVFQFPLPETDSRTSCSLATGSGMHLGPLPGRKKSREKLRAISAQLDSTPRYESDDHDDYGDNQDNVD